MSDRVFKLLFQLIVDITDVAVLDCHVGLGLQIIISVDC